MNHFDLNFGMVIVTSVLYISIIFYVALALIQGHWSVRK